MKNIDILEGVGLTKEQASVYSTLLKKGKMNARNISLKSGIKRTFAYKVLDQLENMGLIEKHDSSGKVATFTPLHPGKLREILENREKTLQKTKEVLSSEMGDFISAFNMLSGKPNVQFFEGDEGVKKVMIDSLNSKTEIYQFIDSDSIVPFIKKENEEYREKRKELKVKKKIIFPDDEYSRKIINEKKDEITEIKILKGLSPFNTTLMIYDDSVSYLTAKEGKKMAVLIEDSDIYELHKKMFEALWQNT